MRVVECIRLLDSYKANAFSDEQKARWLGAIEGQVHTQVFLLSHYDFQPLVFAENWLYTAGTSGLAAGTYHFSLSRHENGLPKTSNRGFSLATALAEGDTLVWDGSTLRRTHTDSAGEQTASEISFSQSSSGALLTFADRSRELLATAPHDSIYSAYLEAMIDFRNNDYDRYANSIQLFNDYWSDFNAYICYNYAPGNGARIG